MSTLDTIEQDLDALDAILADLGGDLSEEAAEAAIDEWLSELGDARDSKLNGYARRIQMLESNAEAKKAEERRLAQQRKRNESDADFLKRRLLGYVQRRGSQIRGKETHQVETTLFTFSEVKNGGKQSLTLLVAPLDLPEDLRRDVVSITVVAEQTRVFAAISAALAEFGGSLLSIERSAVAEEDEIRAALARAEEASRTWTVDQERPTELEIYRFARLEPRGVRLAIR